MLSKMIEKCSPKKCLHRSCGGKACLDLWLEWVIPRYLNDTKPGDNDFLATANAFMEAAAPHTSIGAALALHEALNLLTSPWKKEPMSIKHLDAFTSINEPERASRHMQSIHSALNATWMKELRAAMGHALQEAQYEAGMTSITTILSQESSNAEAW